MKLHRHHVPQLEGRGRGEVGKEHQEQPPCDPAWIHTASDFQAAPQE